MARKEDPQPVSDEEMQQLIRENEKKTLAARYARQQRLKAELQARKRKRGQ